MKIIKRTTIVALCLLIALPCSVQAAQFDAPYYDLAERNKKVWAKQDKQIDKKLAARQWLPHSG